jgi:hypothetical protein
MLLRTQRMLHDARASRSLRTQVVEAQQFGKEAIDVIFAEAERMQHVKPGEATLCVGRTRLACAAEPRCGAR